MQILEKRSSESVKYDIRCGILLSPGETISSVTSVTASPTTAPTPLAFGLAAINAAPTTYTDQYGTTTTDAIGTVIQVQISGGLIAANAQVQDYTVRALFSTNLNPAIEATVVLRLNDTPQK